MNNTGLPPSRNSSGGGPRRRSGVIGWWLNLTTPKMGEENLTFAQRETIRRGNLAGGVIFFLLVALLVVLLINIRGKNYPIVLAVSTMILMTFVAIFCNRAGRTNIAGLLLALGYEVAVFSAILFGFPNGLPPSVIGLYDMLLVSVVFFAICLPAGWLWLPAVINISLIIADTFLQPGTPDFHSMLMTERVAILARPVMLNIIVAAGFFAVVKYMLQSMQRADRAEEVVELERQIIKQRNELEMGIQVIQQALTTAANRAANNEDFSVQIPLTQDNVLWTIASSLNILFQRLKSSRKNINEINQYVQHLTNVLRRAHTAQIAPQFPPSYLGDPWTQFIEALRAYTSSSSQPALPPSSSVVPTRMPQTLPQTPPLAPPSFSTPPSPGSRAPYQPPGRPKTSGT